MTNFLSSLLSYYHYVFGVTNISNIKKMYCLYIFVNDKRGLWDEDLKFFVRFESANIFATYQKPRVTNKICKKSYFVTGADENGHER